jgi:hypothetical protein
MCQSGPCIYTKDNIVILVDVDDMLIFSRSMKKIEISMRSLNNEYYYTDKQGDIKSYFGINVSEACKGTFKLLQPHLLKTLSK